MIEILFAGLCYASGIQTAFANDDASSLRRLVAEAPTRADSLLAQYRLVAMTGDLDLVDAIPDKLGDGATARELAWLSALWGFRAQEAGLLKKPKYGGRSIRLLERAERLAPEDPWVLLVAGQSYLYRPGILGGGVGTAMKRFEAAKAALEQDAECGLPPLEASMWIWMCLNREDRAAAARMKEELLTSDLPPRYRIWLAQES